MMYFPYRWERPVGRDLISRIAVAACTPLPQKMSPQWKSGRFLGPGSRTASGFCQRSPYCTAPSSRRYPCFARSPAQTPCLGVRGSFARHSPCPVCLCAIVARSSALEYRPSAPRVLGVRTFGSHPVSLYLARFARGALKSESLLKTSRRHACTQCCVYCLVLAPTNGCWQPARILKARLPLINARHLSRTR